MRKIVTAYLATIAILALVLGGSAAAAPFDSQISLSADTSACGQVTLTASGFGLFRGATYQLVADRAVQSFTVPAFGAISATFTSSAGWGEATVRTQYGGYLRTTPAIVWYRVAACS